MGQGTRRLIAEGLGSALLFACVVGSGIMAEALAGGNVAIALLGNTLATGAILYVLITIFGPISGGHFNPAVTLVMRLRGEIGSREALAFVVVQLGEDRISALLRQRLTASIGDELWLAPQPNTTHLFDSATTKRLAGA